MFRSGKIVRGARRILVRIVAPVALGWLVATYAHARLYPPPVAESAPSRADYGPVHLKLRLAGTAPGIPEPLLTCGITGSAVEVYIQVMAHAKALVGIDFWGWQKVESEPFQLSAQDARLDVTIYVPALFPEKGSASWGAYSPALQEKWRGQTVIVVDGKVRLKVPGIYPLPPHTPIYYGRNPLGGSFVSDYFTGVIDAISQTF